MKPALKKLRWRVAGLIPAIFRSGKPSRVVRTIIAASYCQFVVADPEGDFGDDPWPGDDVGKGITLGKQSLIAFGTFGDCGEIFLTVWKGSYLSQPRFERVIAAPLEVRNGAVVICAPDEFPGSLRIPVENGVYRLTAAMEDFDEMSQAVDLFIDKADRNEIRQPELVLADRMTRDYWKER